MTSTIQGLEFNLQYLNFYTRSIVINYDSVLNLKVRRTFLLYLYSRGQNHFKTTLSVVSRDLKNF